MWLKLAAAIGAGLILLAAKYANATWKPDYANSPPGWLAWFTQAELPIRHASVFRSKTAAKGQTASRLRSKSKVDAGAISTTGSGKTFPRISSTTRTIPRCLSNSSRRASCSSTTALRPVFGRRRPPGKLLPRFSLHTKNADPRFTTWQRRIRSVSRGSRIAATCETTGFLRRSGRSGRPKLDRSHHRPKNFPRRICTCGEGRKPDKRTARELWITHRCCLGLFTFFNIGG